MANQQQIQKIAANIYLSLDNPDSVKKQLQRVNKAQQELRQVKKEVNAKIKEFNQPEKAFGLDEAAAIGLHLFGKHRIARQVNREGNRAERRSRHQKHRAKQPHLKMRELIDKYLFEGDRLKQMADNYIKEQSNSG